MKVQTWLLMFCLLSASPLQSETIAYFPSVLFGHITIGPAASAYTTTFSIRSRRAGRVVLELFSDRGEPLSAQFLDSQGSPLATAAAFDFQAIPNTTFELSLGLSADDMPNEVAVRSGWATLKTTSDIDVTATVSIRGLNGSLRNRYTLSPDHPSSGN